MSSATAAAFSALDTGLLPLCGPGETPDPEVLARGEPADPEMLAPGTSPGPPKGTSEKATKENAPGAGPPGRISVVEPTTEDQLATHLRGPPAHAGPSATVTPFGREAPTSGLWQSQFTRAPGCRQIGQYSRHGGAVNQLAETCSSSSIKPRVLFGSTGMLGPIDVVNAAFLR